MRLFGIVMAVLLAGCAGEEEGEACDEAGATRCDGDVAQSCDGEVWSELEDCAATGGYCMQDPSMNEGEAHCMPAEM